MIFPKPESQLLPPDTRVSVKQKFKPKMAYSKSFLIDQIIKDNWGVADPSSLDFNLNDLKFILQEIEGGNVDDYLAGAVQTAYKTHHVLTSFAKLCVTRGVADYDTMVLITAMKGAGKSSFAMMLAREYCKIIGIEFDPGRHMVFDGAQLMRKIDELHPFEPLICLTAGSMIKVRFDSDKITRQTEISKLEGRNDFEVMSFNTLTGEFEWKRPEKCIMTHESAEVYEVELMNGLKLRATKDHLFLTKGRGYVQLKNLTEDDEIVVRSIKCKIYSKVKSIRKLAKKTKVYDIVGVEGNHNFVANNMVVHNCDEALNFILAAEWAKSDNREIKKKLGVIRTKHLLFLMCFPMDVKKIESTYMDSFVSYWCLTGDTKITTRDTDGVIRYTPIKDVYPSRFEVLTYNNDSGEYEFKNFDKKVKTKKNAEVFELELENGLKIKCTDNHKFLTQRGYVMLKDLKDSDEIEVHTKKCGMKVKIKSITKLHEREDVYDIIGVDVNHNFVANNMVVHNCDLYARGKGAIFMRNKNSVGDKWNIKDLAKVGAYTEHTPIKTIEKKLKSHPNFWTMVTAPKPPQSLEDKYRKIRDAHTLTKKESDNLTKEEIIRAALIKTFMDWAGGNGKIDTAKIIKHVKINHNLILKKSDVDAVIRDARIMLNKIVEDAQDD